MTKEYKEDKLFVKNNGVLMATPLFLVLLIVEFSDVIFANARYQGGLTQIGDTGEGDNVKNSVFQIGLGFRF